MISRACQPITAAYLDLPDPDNSTAFRDALRPLARPPGRAPRPLLRRDARPVRPIPAGPRRSRCPQTPPPPGVGCAVAPRRRNAPLVLALGAPSLRGGVPPPRPIRCLRAEVGNCPADPGAASPGPRRPPQAPWSGAFFIPTLLIRSYRQCGCARPSSVRQTLFGTRHRR